MSDTRVQRLIDQTKELRQGRLHGLHEGRIESIDDPQRLGRLQVRIWALHGGTEDTVTGALPWCPWSTPGGAGHDHGPSHDFLVGQDVWIMFRNADVRFPVVLGGMHGAAAEPIEMLTRAGQPTSEQPWLAPVGSTVPGDVFADRDAADLHATRKVWHKSYKGHTILVEDRDGAEFLKVIDRAGQVIELSCPVTAAANADNAARRGVRDAAAETQLGHDQLVDRRAYIRLRDVSGQEIILDGREGHENITLTSQCRNGTRQQKITLSARQGDDAITLRDTVGNLIQLSAWRDDSVQIRSQTGSELALARNGDVRMTVKGDFALDVNGKVTETFRRDREIEYQGGLKEGTLGNRMLKVAGSLVQFVGAGLSTLVTGSQQTVLANASLDGAAADAWSVTALLGNLTLKTLMGAVTLMNLLAKIEVDALGNITLQTDALGNITLQTPAGSLMVSAAGVITLNNGAVPCNNLPACLFTGAPHGTNPTVLVP